MDYDDAYMITMSLDVPLSHMTANRMKYNRDEGELTIGQFNNKRKNNTGIFI